MSISCPIPEIKLFQTLTLKLQGQGHGCGQRASSYSWPRTHYLFSSNQSYQQSLRYSYFEIWPWNMQGQGHEWGQRSKSHIIPSMQPMHFLFVSHQLDQPFLRYGQNSDWPWNKANLRDLIAATGLVILLKFDPNHRFFVPCDLEIWWMALENNRAPLLYYIKLCASFQIHRWIQIGITVRKR